MEKATFDWALRDELAEAPQGWGHGIHSMRDGTASRQQVPNPKSMSAAAAWLTAHGQMG